ncbi:MAG: hypothetical protein ACE149_07985 [Armatimonadota bacterium]
MAKQSGVKAVLACAVIVAALTILSIHTAAAGIAAPAGPRVIAPSAGTPAVPSAGVAIPAPRRDVALVSVCGQIGGGPVQLGPDFVADLADRPTALSLTALVANTGNEPATVYVDLARPPYQLIRSSRPAPTRIEPGRTASFELECRLRGLYETKMTEVPFVVAVLPGEEFEDQAPANNSINCTLSLGRPDVVVTDVQLQPRVLARPPDQTSGYEHLTAIVYAFITIENQGKGRLPAGAATLNWSAMWRKMPFMWGEPPDHPITFINGRRADGFNNPPVQVPSLEPGGKTVMWLQESSPHETKPEEGRVVMTLTLTCRPQAGTSPYEEANALNNQRVFDIPYFLPDVYAYHPIRGTDYDNRH